MEKVWSVNPKKSHKNNLLANRHQATGFQHTKNHFPIFVIKKATILPGFRELMHHF